LLEAALRKATPGPLQVEAAIAATHTRAARYEDTDWAELDRLYRALEIIRPSPVVTLNRAVVIAKLEGPAEALRRLEHLAAPLQRYASYYALRASLMHEIGESNEARLNFERALELSGTDAERRHIERKLASLVPAI